MATIEYDPPLGSKAGQTRHYVRPNSYEMAATKELFPDFDGRRLSFGYGLDALRRAKAAKKDIEKRERDLAKAEARRLREEKKAKKRA